MEYSLFSLLNNARSGHARWPRAWRRCKLAARYNVVIVGGGGHGIATAYYLAKKHGIRKIAVLEKSWLGGGNTARNTTIIRSNYLHQESAALYGFSHSLWPGLSAELNFNIMFSPRGVIKLAHSQSELDSLEHQYHTMKVYGMDVELLTADELKPMVPQLNLSKSLRFPVSGGLIQRNAGVARHDALAWGYARQASRLGVDIVENCEVTGFIQSADAITGVVTRHGEVRSEKVVLSVAGDISHLAQLAGLELPITTVPLQALVSEPIKPALDQVVVSDTLLTYVSQSDKGELVIGTNADPYVSYKRSGSIHTLESSVAALCELFPRFRRLRMLRQWGGSCDVTPDSSPILGPTGISGLYINCGFGTGGFKATPGTAFLMADTIANNRTHPILEPFLLQRFREGRLLSEHTAAGGH